MRNLALAILFAFGVAGCAQLQNDWNAITGSAVSPTAVIVAGNSFDALEATATNYLRLPKCVTGGTPICRNPKATAIIIPAVRSGRVARNNLEQFLTDHPGQLGPQGLYDALSASINTLRGAFTQFGIN